MNSAFAFHHACIVGTACIAGPELVWQNISAKRLSSRVGDDVLVQHRFLSKFWGKRYVFALLLGSCSMT